MNIGFLITARLKSTRLPKKVLLPLNGYTVIERVIKRAKQVVEPDKVVLCTSTDHEDFPLVETAIKNKIYYFNGHPDDVLQRLMDAAKLFGFDFFMGITADNPLFSIEYAKQIKGIMQNDSSFDYLFTSNLPIGLIKTLRESAKQLGQRQIRFRITKITRRIENYRPTLLIYTTVAVPQVTM